MTLINPCFQEALHLLQERIGYNFKNIRLLEQALTHKSFNREFNYERLEYLGDSLLSAIVSQWLYLRHEGLAEGVMGENRSIITNNRSLAIAARRLGLQRILRTSDAQRRQLIVSPCGKAYADVYEALLAAIFMDAGELGYSETRRFIECSLLTQVSVRVSIEQKVNHLGLPRRQKLATKFKNMRRGSA